MELADVLDSKSSGSDTVSVRPRSPAPTKKGGYASFFCWCRRSLRSDRSPREACVRVQTPTGVGGGYASFFDKLMFVGGVLCSFLSTSGKKRTKETPLGEWEVSIKQKQSRIKNNQTVRLLLDFNISPSPKTPPPLRAHPFGLARAWVCQSV